MRADTTCKELKAQQSDQLRTTNGSASGPADDSRLQQAREAHQVALRDQNDLLLLVFQSFVTVLANHLANCQERDADPYDAWYHSAMGHFKEIARKYHREANALGEQLAHMFAQSCDSRITSVLDQLHLLCC
jgi:hypothetical protein